MLTVLIMHQQGTQCELKCMDASVDQSHDHLDQMEDVLRS